MTRFVRTLLLPLFLPFFVGGSVYAASTWVTEVERHLVQALMDVPEGAYDARATSRPYELHVLWGSPADAHVLNSILQRLGRNARAVSILHEIRNARPTPVSERTLRTVRGLSEVFSLLSRPEFQVFDEVRWIAGPPHFQSVNEMRGMLSSIESWRGLQGRRPHQTVIFRALKGIQAPAENLSDLESQRVREQLELLFEIRKQLSKGKLLPEQLRRFVAYQAPIREYVNRYGARSGSLWTEQRLRRLIHGVTGGLDLPQSLIESVSSRVLNVIANCNRSFE